MTDHAQDHGHRHGSGGPDPIPGLSLGAGGVARELFVHSASASNTGTGETDLFTDTIAANTLASDHDVLELLVGGAFVGHATATQRLRLYFAGSVLLDTGALTVTVASSWTLRATLVRHTFASVVFEAVLLSTGPSVKNYQAASNVGSLNLTTTAYVLKTTGQAAGVGAASSQTVASIGTVAYSPKP